mmetsp:Transcript_21702/g.47174  ORF Transcript_21702/g.47174 Transcript_21702/m.47174 type:complete len:559 (-) Transcript_21702:167-1843(-)
MRQILKWILCPAFLLCLRCAAWAAQPQPAATRQRTFNNSNSSNGNDGGDAIRGRNKIIGDEKDVSSDISSSDDGSDVHINIIIGDELFDSSRRLQNKITSNHIIQLEFSGVIYASMSLDIVEADLVNVVQDVLTTHLGNYMEVVDVQRGDCSPNCRKLRGSSQRRLSYIRLVVSISLRRSPWISLERASTTTIEILSEYVDNDFRQYMRSLPGNGEYLGTVDVSNYHNDISINLPSTSEPISIPTQTANWQTTTTGVSTYNLIFTEVSPNYANSEALRNYIRYSITKILDTNLDSSIELVDVYLQPWLPEMWLSFPMLITFQYPTSQDDAFARVDDVLNRNIGDIDLYLNEYIATSPISAPEKTELESILKDVFGELVSVEIDKEDPKPTQAPTKVIIPANDWLNMGADTVEMKIPWWGWVILGVGVALIATCCCCCILQYTGRKRAAMSRKPTTVTNIIQVREPTREPIRSMNGKGSVDFVENKESTTENDGGKDKLSQSFTLAPLQIPAQQLLYNPNPRADVVLYGPNTNSPDPDETIQEPKKKTKKKKKRKNRDP